MSDTRKNLARVGEPASSERSTARSGWANARAPSLWQRSLGHFLDAVPPRLGAAERADPARTRERRYRRLLGLADILATLLALSLCINVLGRGNTVSLALLAAVPVVVVIAKVLGLYDRDELVLHRSTLDEAPMLFQLATLFTLVVAIGQAPLQLGEIGGDQALALWLLLFLALVATRVVARTIARHTTPRERCILIGGIDECEMLRTKLDHSRAIKARVVERVTLSQIDEGELPPSVLRELIAEKDIERVVFAPRNADHGEVLDLVRAAKSLGVHVSVLPRLLEVVGSSVVVDDVEGVRVLGVSRFGLTRSSALVKRSLDVAGSGLGLLFLAPLMALIALAIKVDSPGPVLFRQKRIGRGNRPFWMLKFRTMFDGADEQKAQLLHRNERPGLFKISDDPRITRVGRLLRRTYLDELPQLLNVLRGDMSLVGPRPLVVEDDARILGFDRERLHLAPGMTGPWQVTGVIRPPLAEMVKLDYLYCATWSLWGDVKILLRTVALMFAHRGL